MERIWRISAHFWVNSYQSSQCCSPAGKNIPHLFAGYVDSLGVQYQSEQIWLHAAIYWAVTTGHPDPSVETTLIGNFAGKAAWQSSWKLAKVPRVASGSTGVCEPHMLFEVTLDCNTKLLPKPQTLVPSFSVCFDHPVFAYGLHGHVNGGVQRELGHSATCRITFRTCFRDTWIFGVFERCSVCKIKQVLLMGEQDGPRWEEQLVAGSSFVGNKSWQRPHESWNSLICIR